MLTLTKKPKPKKKSPSPEQMDAERIASRIPVLKTLDTPLGKEAHAAGLRTQELRAKLQDLRQQLDKHSSRSCSPGWRFSEDRVAEDAKTLAGGAALSTLECHTVQDPRSTLLRQIAAVEAAIPLAEHRAQKLRFQLQQEELERLHPLGRELGRELVEAYEHLHFILERNRQVYSLMHSRGFDHLLLQSTPWSLTPFDEFILSGGNGRMSLQAWIQNRKQAWGLSE